MCPGLLSNHTICAESPLAIVLCEKLLAGHNSHVPVTSMCELLTTILAQGYLLVLLFATPSLKGLAYMALLIVVFVAPPLRGTYQEFDDMGRTVASAHSVVHAVFHGQRRDLGEAIHHILPWLVLPPYGLSRVIA